MHSSISSSQMFISKKEGQANADSSRDDHSSSRPSPKSKLASTVSDYGPFDDDLSRPCSGKRKDKEKGISRTVTTFFKTLFTSKAEQSHGLQAAVPVPKIVSSPSPTALAPSPPSPTEPALAPPSTLAAATPVSPVSSKVSAIPPDKVPAASPAQEANAGETPQPLASDDLVIGASSNLPLSGSRPKASSPMPPSSPLKPSRSPSSNLKHASRSTPSHAAKEAKLPTILLAMSQALPPKMAREHWCLKDYAIVEKMYTGYASTVYKAWCKSSGETVCLKAYNLANLCELNRFQIYREVKLHSNLQHENIIKLYGAFQEVDQVVLVQEFADSGDLFLILHKYGGKLPEKTAVEMILHPFLKVLTYLHQNCVAHRDIKPENVLFTRSMQLKICDFGLAIDLREERAVTRAGTLEYMAPEVLDCPFKNRPEENKEKENLYYSMTVDTWAMGVLSYELLVGFPPFNDKQRAAIEEKIRFEQPRFPSNMSEAARMFILRALQKDPVERPSALELLNSAWIRSNRRGAAPSVAQSASRPSNLSTSGAQMAPASTSQMGPAIAALRGSVITPSSPTAARPANAVSPRTVLTSAPPNSPFSPAGGKSLRPAPVPEHEEGQPGYPASPSVAYCISDNSRLNLESLCSKQSEDLRTVEGDLIRAMPAYLSFTAGTIPPRKPTQESLGGAKLKLPPVAVGMSFNSAAQPKMQQVRQL